MYEVYFEMLAHIPGSKVQCNERFVRADKRSLELELESTAFYIADVVDKSFRLHTLE